MIITISISFIILSFIAIINIQGKNDKFIIFILGFFLILFAGLRPEGSTKDYLNYISGYNSVETFNLTRLEPTFFLIATTTKKCCDNPKLLFLIYATLGVTFKLIAIRNISKLLILSTLIYISYYYLLHEMTQIRVGVASAILLLSIKPIYERNLKKFLILLLIAISFHYTAIIMFLLWFLKPKSLNHRLFLLLIPISYLLVIFNFSLTSLIEFIPIKPIQVLYKMHKFEMEHGIGEYINIFNVIQLLRCMLCLMFIHFHKLLEKHNKFSILLIKIYTLSLVSFVIFSDFPVISFRISELLGIVEIILIPFLIYIFKPRQLSTLFPVSLASVFLFLSLFYIELIL
ncbi:MAG: EpsG family protein [bacterium]